MAAMMGMVPIFPNMGGSPPKFGLNKASGGGGGAPPKTAKKPGAGGSKWQINKNPPKKKGPCVLALHVCVYVCMVCMVAARVRTCAWLWITTMLFYFLFFFFFFWLLPTRPGGEEEAHNRQASVNAGRRR